MPPTSIRLRRQQPIRFQKRLARQRVKRAHGPHAQRTLLAGQRVNGDQLRRFRLPLGAPGILLL